MKLFNTNNTGIETVKMCQEYFSQEYFSFEVLSVLLSKRIKNLEACFYACEMLQNCNGIHLYSV